MPRCSFPICSQTSPSPELALMPQHWSMHRRAPWALKDRQQGFLWSLSAGISWEPGGPRENHGCGGFLCGSFGGLTCSMRGMEVADVQKTSGWKTVDSG